ncbi:MAG: hypothetical protein KGJ47_11360, partial [Acidobacteriota bacterium]|nr:hypothetical protein [Acidobacteriota bacterium]
MSRGVIALLGSGETAPGMTKVHRRLLARHDDVLAVNLDSPYGFQENVEQVTGKLVDYFDTSLHTQLRALALPSYESASDVERALVKHAVRSATYVFAGPGSPSYALAQWTPLDLVSDLRAVLDNDGTVCFSSAAVLTLGSHTAPIYEIYKVGAPATWLEGLDLFAELGLSCAAIPHFDNAEGRNYDTRYCYIGERRLVELEEQLPTGTAILGVDEHTALTFDLAADSVSVTGRGHGHWRYRAQTLTLENGTTTDLRALREFAHATTAVSPRPRPTEPSRDLDALLASVHTQPSFDPAPLIDALLTLRGELKARGDYDLADALRRALTDSGVEVRDTPDGVTWT